MRATKRQFFIAGLASFGILLSSCERNPEVQKTRKEESQNKRENILNRAPIVCRDGTQYIFGWMNSGDRGGPFVTPYVVNGHFMSCDGKPSGTIDTGTKK